MSSCLCYLIQALTWFSKYPPEFQSSSQGPTPSLSLLINLAHPWPGPAAGPNPTRPVSFASFSSVQFSRSVTFNSLRPHGPQHARPPCPSPTPGVYPNPCPSSPWCHSTISSSVIPFTSCPQSFPASGSFPMSQLFTSGGQSIGVSAATSVLPMNTQDWSPLRWTGWISLQSKGLSWVFSNTGVQKHQFFCVQVFFYSPTLTSIHDHWKNHSLD